MAGKLKVAYEHPDGRTESMDLPFGEDVVQALVAASDRWPDSSPLQAFADLVVGNVGELLMSMAANEPVYRGLGSHPKRVRPCAGCRHHTLCEDVSIGGTTVFACSAQCLADYLATEGAIGR